MAISQRIGQLGHVDSSDRLAIAIDILRTVEWWQAQTVDVMAELVRPGLIRAYWADEARPLIEAMHAGLLEATEDPESQFERIQAFGDRYRSLKLYADGRLRLTKEVAGFLGFSLGERAVLYVQPFFKGLEVMSVEFRHRRLAETSSSNIGLHLRDPK